MAGLIRYILLWCLLAGVAVGARFLNVPPAVQTTIERTALIIFLLSATLLLAGLATQLTPLVVNRFALPLTTAAFAAEVLRFVIFVIGAMLILSNLGIAIGPLLTALGVGSL